MQLNFFLLDCQVIMAQLWPGGRWTRGACLVLLYLLQGQIIADIVSEGLKYTVIDFMYWDGRSCTVSSTVLFILFVVNYRAISTYGTHEILNQCCLGTERTLFNTILLHCNIVYTTNIDLTRGVATYRQLRQVCRQENNLWECRYVVHASNTSTVHT